MICCFSALICREASGRFDGKIASKCVLDANSVPTSESFPTSSQRKQYLDVQRSEGHSADSLEILRYVIIKLMGHRMKMGGREGMMHCCRAEESMCE